MNNKKFYCLDMFPYPSGSGLHVGHVEGYTASDIFSRYKRMKGFNVIHPMGWDSFGLPAENYAIKTGVHPSKTVDTAINNFTSQMKKLGLEYDWEREVKTSSSEYYRWTQWLFLLLYKNGLAYKKKAKVNWCEKCSTVLANEQAETGFCERCGDQVVQKDLEQWFFKISDFIEDQEFEGKKIKGLLSGLDDIDWPQTTKIAQKNWIGKSVGAEVIFAISDDKDNYNLNVFTTRPDTLYGCTYMAINPEHEIVEKFKNSIKNLSEVSKYIEESKKKTDMEKIIDAKDKTGVELEGISAINPLNNKRIKIFVADYVLSGYGSGAIMAVPAHDERDYAFAKKYNLEIIEVISGGDISKEAYTGDGTLINSEIVNGLSVEEAKKKIIKYLEDKKIGQASVNYRLRDWLISRQRYWGAPIPIIYCDKCGELPVPEKDLPVLLPEDVDFLPTGESPLKYSKSFHEVNCPLCGKKARRENDTMDTFVCSSWYYFRYLDPKNEQIFAEKDKISQFMPVDLYIGGADHSVMHLLYARFIAKVLQRYDYTDINEPFKKLRHQGMILAEDGSKMSKSKGSVVNPNDVVSEYGADALRLYEMFMGPLEEVKPWNTKNILGVKRFLEKTEILSEKVVEDDSKKDSQDVILEINKTIKKVGEDIEELKFNTAISQLMIMLNLLGKKEKISFNTWKKFLLVLAPFAPFTSENLWLKLNEKKSIFEVSWPEYDSSLLAEEKVSLAVQFNGKTRGLIDVEPNTEESVIISMLKDDEKFKKYLSGAYKKVIYVKNRIINFIV
ncbi:MAG: leucine--tRNA ligase [Patescibacteria group bacterium]|nr:leucine--tRNA ligase [Patescibacteria group bacterium]